MTMNYIGSKIPVDVFLVKFVYCLQGNSLSLRVRAKVKKFHCHILARK